MAELSRSPNGPNRASLRASDADEQAVASVLSDAASQGKLTFSEYDDRVKDVWNATTLGQLDVLVADVVSLGAFPGPVRTGSALASPHDAVASGRAVAIMGGFTRKGEWTVPAQFTAVAFWGGGTLDLRRASFSADSVHISCTAIMGGIEVVVSKSTNIEMRGTGIMGGFEHRSATPSPGQPRVIVTGLALMGGVSLTVKN